MNVNVNANDVLLMFKILSYILIYKVLPCSDSFSEWTRISLENNLIILTAGHHVLWQVLQQTNYMSKSKM